MSTTEESKGNDKGAAKPAGGGAAKPAATPPKGAIKPLPGGKKK